MSIMHRFSSSITERVRGLFKRRVSDGELAYLGDTHGAGSRVDVPGKNGYVYIHFPDGRDESGFARFSQPTIARSSGAAYINAPGSTVYVAVRYNNELEIVSANYAGMDRAGIDTRVLNPLNQQSKFVYPYQLTYGLASAVATSATTSFLVMVKSLRHYTGNVFKTFATPLQANKINLSSYVPAADMHCYAAVWIDTYTNTAVVTTSVSQSLFTPLDETDLQELIVRTASSRPADGIPLKAFYLSNGQSTIQQSALDVDLRQWLDNPVPWGFPTTLTTIERVRPGYTLITGAISASGVGALTVVSGGKHIIVPDTVAPGDATYILKTANASLTNAQVMGVLATGLVKNTTTTGVQSIAVAGTDYTTPTGTENLSSKTITASSLIATAIQLLIGGFKAIFTHANTVDRTYTLPNYDGTLATLAGTETLTSKTLTTPAIADLTNMQHDHTDADDGGQIPLTALTASGASLNHVARFDGTNWGPSVTMIPIGTVATATDTGTAGEVRGDTNFLYHCYATNLWNRYAKSAW